MAQVTYRDPKRTKFVGHSWSDLPNTGISREHYGPGWMKQHDLAVEAFEATGLKFEYWRDMIAACYAGLPITLTLTKRNHATQKSTCIITQILSYHPNTTCNMYIRCWGFSHPISWKEISNVEVPRTEYF